ncbi:hypothetical protein GCK72_023105 [Caenorhabditis remanei]|uniref:EF-hand domain-containing protein n=1 Tax=Caenorhabditis remanei TaxID=31234 RepID=A0A6A5FVK7_CAERE|nr:hypothetical protein GCK72_023105 [Caenorhabditis remanei]KAF1746648.1 hypothetical protein GCK72_023105 [Caenorhabditis remanei]
MKVKKVKRNSDKVLIRKHASHDNITDTAELSTASSSESEVIRPKKLTLNTLITKIFRNTGNHDFHNLQLPSQIEQSGLKKSHKRETSGKLKESVFLSLDTVIPVTQKVSNSKITNSTVAENYLDYECIQSVKDDYLTANKEESKTSSRDAVSWMDTFIGNNIEKANQDVNTLGPGYETHVRPSDLKKVQRTQKNNILVVDTYPPVEVFNQGYASPTIGKFETDFPDDLYSIVVNPGYVSCLQSNSKKAQPLSLWETINGRDCESWYSKLRDGKVSVVNKFPKQPRNPDYYNLHDYYFLFPLEKDPPMPLYWRKERLPTPEEAKKANKRKLFKEEMAKNADYLLLPKTSRFHNRFHYQNVIDYEFLAPYEHPPMPTGWKRTQFMMSLNLGNRTVPYPRKYLYDTFDEFSKHQMHEFVRIFYNIGKSSKKKLDLIHIRLFLDKMGKPLDGSSLKYILDLADVNKNGELSLEEFVSLFRIACKYQSIDCLSTFRDIVHSVHGDPDDNDDNSEGRIVCTKCENLSKRTI